MRNINNAQELYTAIKEVEFNNLDADSKGMVYQAYCTLYPDSEMPEAPLTEAGFNFIKDCVAQDLAVEELVNRANKSKEDKEMNGAKNVKATVEAAKESMMNSVKNIKVKAGETAEEFVDSAQEEINTINATFVGVLEVISNFVGYEDSKDRILGILAAGLNEKSGRHDLFKMAKKCREYIEDEIEFLTACGSEQNLKNAAAWKTIITSEDEEYEIEYSKSIFEVLVASLIWAKKKIAKKLRHNFGIHCDETGILGSICNALRFIGEIMRCGVKVVVKAGKYAFSFLAAGIIKFVNFVVNCIKTAVAKAKDFLNKKNSKSESDDFEDDFEDFPEEDVILE